MSFAGRVGGSQEQRRAEVTAALARLAYQPLEEPHLFENAECTLGVVNDSTLWTGDGVAAVFRGALYERTDLRHTLGLDSDACDAEFCARAYKRWGDTFPDHLYGEFSFALWDAPRHALLLGRDANARVSVSYAEKPDGPRFASEWLGLDGWTGVDTTISDEMIARILAMEPADGAWLYRDIRGVLGGTVRVFSAGEPSREVQYWFPLRQPELIVKDWREYGDALRSALFNAVRVRIPAEGLVGSQLSSGFDSSGVSALAAQVLLQQNRPLVCYTSVPTTATDARAVMGDRFDNEWPLAAQVAARYPNIEHVAIPTDAADWWQSMDTLADLGGGPIPFIRNTRWYHGIMQDAQNRGLVTMLEGQAGNLTASYNGSFGLYDLRRRGRWAQLSAAVQARRRSGAGWREIVHGVWLPSLRTLSIVQRLRGREAPKLFDHTMMRREFYEASGIPQRKLSALGGPVEGDRNSGSAWRLSILSKGDLGAMEALVRRQFGLHREDPMADRRLIELCLRIPDEAFAPDGRKRDLYRYALRKDLPQDLLQNPMRGLQASDFLNIFERWLPQWYEELERLEHSPQASRALDLPRMRSLLDTFQNRVQENRAAADLAYNYSFGGAISFGRFLRRRENITR